MPILTLIEQYNSQANIVVLKSLSYSISGGLTFKLS